MTGDLSVNREGVHRRDDHRDLPRHALRRGG